MKKHFFYIAIGILFSGCQQAPEALKNEKADSELKAFITDYYTVMSERDWEAYKGFFMEKARLTTIWQEPGDSQPKLFSNSISEFLEQTANGPDSQPIFEEKPIKIETKIKDNLANVWVNYEAKFGTEDELVEWKGHDLFSLLKYNGRWYIVSLTYISEE